MDLTSASNLDLIRRCKGNEARAWREFSRRFTKQVYSLCLRMLRNQAEAEDATQETFVRVHRYLDRFDSSRPLEPWLAGIGYNVCLRRMPGVVAAARGEDDLDQVSSEEETDGLDRMEDGASSREEAALLHSGLTALAAQDRALLHMHYWQGLGMAEIADAVEMPVNTVKIRLFRARTRLREVLGPLMGGGELWT